MGNDFFTGYFGGLIKTYMGNTGTNIGIIFILKNLMVVIFHKFFSAVA
jgi:hypothetical protein